MITPLTTSNVSYVYMYNLSDNNLMDKMFFRLVCEMDRVSENESFDMLDDLIYDE